MGDVQKFIYFYFPNLLNNVLPQYCFAKSSRT